MVCRGRLGLRRETRLLNETMYLSPSDFLLFLRARLRKQKYNFILRDSIKSNFTGNKKGEQRRKIEKRYERFVRCQSKLRFPRLTGRKVGRSFRMHTSRLRVLRRDHVRSIVRINITR